MKCWLPPTTVVYQQGLKGVQTIRNLTSPNPVQETVNLPETGKRTGHILTGGETQKDTTGIGARSVMVIAIGTDGTTHITTILALTEIALLIIAHIGTGSLAIIGIGLSTTPGIVTVTSIPTTTATGPETNAAVSGGGTVIPTAKDLRVIGSGKTSTENPG